MKFSSRVLKIADYPSANLAARKKKLKAEGKRLFDFGTGDPIEPTPSFIREAVGPAVPEVSQYPTVKGSEALIQSICGYMDRRFGVKLDPAKEVIQATGSKESIFNIAFLFIEPGCEKNIIIGPMPGYFVMERSATICGAEYYPYDLNPENNYLLDLETVPESILNRTAIVWINYPHNPTGAECDLAYLKKQVAICQKYGILLASDECYVDMYYGDAKPPSVLEVTKEGVIAFHSCSKRSGMTAYRSGFVAGDSKVIELYSNYRNTLGVATPIYTQAAATVAWADDKHVDERRAIFKEKRKIFLEFFDRNGFWYCKTDSTFYFWVKCPKGYTGQTYATKLMDLGIIVNPGEFFGPNCGDYFRVALVPSSEDSKEALTLWKTIL